MNLLAASLLFATVQTTTVATFDSKGFKIRYATAGTGEPVVLLHGWMGEATMWGKAANGQPKLSPPPGIMAIAVDLRGHGGSDKPHEPKKYGAEMAADVVRLLDHLKLPRAHLVGYSMGAFVAGKMVERWPARVSSVLYGGSSPVLNTRAVKGFSDADAFARAVEKGQGLGSYLLEVSPGMTLSLEAANKLADRMYGHLDTKAMAAVGKSFGKMQVDAKRLAKANVPTLIVYGANESKYVKDRVAELQVALPKAQVKVIPGANHITTPAHPDFGTALIDFVNQNKAK